MTAIRVQPLTAEAFAPYGKVMTKPQEEPGMVREDFEGWLGLGGLEGLDPEQATWAILSARRHQMPVKKLERHTVCAEVFIPLTGNSVIVVAPASDPKDPDAKPDEDKVAAFLLDGSAALVFPAGGWHWVPFAISERADFLLLLQKNLDIEEREIQPRTLEIY